MGLQIDKAMEKVPLCPSYRLLVVLCITATTLFILSTFACMSSALVCMTTSSQTDHSDLDQTEAKENWTVNTTLELNQTQPSQWKFAWSPQEKALTVTMFFLGSYVMLFPTGLILVKCGSKATLVFCLAVMTVLQLLAIPAALMGLTWLYVDRFLTGLASGPPFPAVAGIVASWAPPNERSFLMGLANIGCELGSVFTFSISSVSCPMNIQGGWPFVFYISGGLGVVVLVLNILFVSNVPFTNRRLGAKEKTFLTRSSTVLQTGAEKVHFPLGKIMRSLPMWAVFFSKLGTDFVFFFVLTEAPVFLADVLKLSESEVSFATGIPYVSVLPAVFIGGSISDKLVAKGVLSMTTVRKLNDGIGKLIPGALFIALGYLPEKSVGLSFTVVTLVVSGVGFGYLSGYTNVADLAPNMSGPLLSLASVFAGWNTFVTPVVVTRVTPGSTREEWQRVFFFASSFCIVVMIFYAIFASGDLQPWATDGQSRDFAEVEGRQGQSQGSHDVTKRLKLKKGVTPQPLLASDDDLVGKVPNGGPGEKTPLLCDNP